MGEVVRLEPLSLVRAAKQMVAATHVHWHDVVGPSRLADVCRTRFAIWRVMYDDYGMSMPWIGKLFGNRDHTTVLHGVRKARLCDGSGNDIDGMMHMYRDALRGHAVFPAHIVVAHAQPKYVKAMKAEHRTVEKPRPPHRRYEAAFLRALRAAHPERETAAYRRTA